MGSIPFGLCSLPDCLRRRLLSQLELMKIGALHELLSGQPFPERLLHPVNSQAADRGLSG